MRNPCVRLLWIAVAGALTAVPAAAQTQAAMATGSDRAPIVGEVRAFIVAPGQSAATAKLHASGWIEAAGQRLRRADYPELFAGIGTARSSRRVPADAFVLPKIGAQEPADDRDPYGVLGPGDLVTSGLPQQPSSRLTWFIYAGRPVR
jgi:hypothetical protein